jgi:hypothetical protein
MLLRFYICYVCLHQLLCHTIIGFQFYFISFIFFSVLLMFTMQVAATCVTGIYMNNDRHNKMDSIKLIISFIITSYVTLLLCKCYT